MAISSGIITGLVGYTNQVRNNENMTNMLISMVVFYIVGLLIRGTVLDAIETNRIKEEERIEEEKRKAIEEKKREAEEKEEKKQKQTTEKASGSTLDIAADEDINLEINEEEFEALPIADYITNELKK
jgi:mannitol-specific phosphotransferase system IIBC component